MGGTVAGGRKAAQMNRELYDEIYLEKYSMTFYQYLGQKGGQAKVPKGFAKMPKDAVRALGLKGGTISRRT